MQKRLSPAEFKELAKSKGWTFRALSERWGCTPVWISVIANDEARSVKWDDAIHGLPVCLIDRAKTKTPRARAKRQRLSARPERGYRYRGDLVPGSRLMASEYIGEYADAGDGATVIRVIDTGDGESYAIRFDLNPSPAEEIFAPDDIDRWFASAGVIVALNSASPESAPVS